MNLVGDDPPEVGGIRCGHVGPLGSTPGRSIRTTARQRNRTGVLVINEVRPGANFVVDNRIGQGRDHGRPGDDE